MPELPEVETVRRGLQPVMEGERITRVETRRGDLRFPFKKISRHDWMARLLRALAAARNISWQTSRPVTCC